MFTDNRPKINKKPFLFSLITYILEVKTVFIVQSIKRSGTVTYFDIFLTKKTVPAPTKDVTSFWMNQ